EGAAFARLANALTDPFTSDDDDVKDYSDIYYEYNSSKAISTEIVGGYGGTDGGLIGQGTFTFDYYTSSNTDDFNAWKYKTIETLPNGSTETVYTNFAGEAIFIIQSGG